MLFTHVVVLVTDDAEGWIFVGRTGVILFLKGVRNFLRPVVVFGVDKGPDIRRFDEDVTARLGGKGTLKTASSFEVLAGVVFGVTSCKNLLKAWSFDFDTDSSRVWSTVLVRFLFSSDKSA